MHLLGVQIGSWLSANDSSRSEACGVFTSSAEPVPLKSREVFANVLCDLTVADTVERLTYVAGSQSVSSTFKFPLPPRSAVYRFKATIGDREVVTEVKPKEQAEEEFGLAVAQGHSAVLMKEEKSARNIFSVELGNLEAGQQCVVEFAYLRLLDSIAGTIEFSHTATWVPPYSNPAYNSNAAAVGEDPMSSQPALAARVSYSLKYHVTLQSRLGIGSVEVGGHDGCQVEGTAGGNKLVTMVEEVADPSKDLTLLVEVARPTPHDAAACSLMRQVSARPLTGQPKTVLLATFVPPPPHAGTIAGTTNGTANGTTQQQGVVVLPPGTALGVPVNPGAATAMESSPAAAAATAPAPAATATATAAATAKKEVILVVDCSGSMGGRPIGQARDAALFFVNDLPTGADVRFNIYLFGSNFVSMWPGGSSRQYDGTTQAEAVAFVTNRCHADMGGTEVLPVMKDIYSRPVPAGYERHILFLTDGGVDGGQEGAVLQLAAEGAISHGGAGGGSSGGGVAKKIKKWFFSAAQDGAGAAGTSNGAGAGTTDAGTGKEGGEGGEVSKPPPPACASAAPVSALLGATQVHCLGIGQGVHRGLLDGLAARTGGVVKYVGDDEDIAVKTAYLKKVAMAEGAWEAPRLLARGAVVRPVPHVLPTRLFPGEPLQVLVEVVKAEPGASLELSMQPPGTALLAGRAGAGAGAGAAPLTISLSLDEAQDLSVEQVEQASAAPSTALSVLHAMLAISTLMDGCSYLHVGQDGERTSPAPSKDKVKEAVVRLAVAEGLVTPYTAAVGVMLRRDPLDPKAVVRSDVPLQLPHGRTMCNTAPPPQDMEYCKIMRHTSAVAGPSVYPPMTVPGSVYCPTSPAYNSCAPTAYPGAYVPTSPAYSPTSPAYNSCAPTAGGYVPTSPAYSPCSPVYSPTSPAYSPRSPAYSPCSPGPCCDSPMYSPTSPAYSYTPSPSPSPAHEPPPSPPPHAHAPATAATAAGTDAADADGAGCSCAAAPSFYGGGTRGFGGSRLLQSARAPAAAPRKAKAAYAANVVGGPAPPEAVQVLACQAAVQQSLDQVLARGEKLECLADKSESLQFECDRFTRVSKKKSSGLGGMLGGLLGVLGGGGGTAAAKASLPPASCTMPAAAMASAPAPGLGAAADLCEECGSMSEDADEQCEKEEKEVLQCAIGGAVPASASASASDSKQKREQKREREREREGSPSAAPAPTAVPKPGQAATTTASSIARVAPSDVLRQLNLQRTVEGYWSMDDALLTLLLGGALSATATAGHGGGAGAGATAVERAGVAGGEAEALAMLRGALPAELKAAGVGEDEWATLLVLAFLSKHCRSEATLWEALRDKALAWLKTKWPAAGVKGPTVVVLQTMALL